MCLAIEETGLHRLGGILYECPADERQQYVRLTKVQRRRTTLDFGFNFITFFRTLSFELAAGFSLSRQRRSALFIFGHFGVDGEGVVSQQQQKSELFL